MIFDKIAAKSKANCEKNNTNSEEITARNGALKKVRLTRYLVDNLSMYYIPLYTDIHWLSYSS